MTSRVLAFTWMALAAASGAGAQERARLFLGPEQVGHELRYVIETRETFTTTMEATPTLERRAENMVGVMVKPTRLDERGGAAEVWLKSYAFAVINPAGVRNGFDSAKPNENSLTADLAEDFKLMTVRPVTVEFDAAGQIFAINGVEQLPRTRLWTRLEQELFSLEAMNRKVQPILGGGKEPPTAQVGDTWTTVDDLRLAPGYSIELTSRNTLAAIRDGAAEVRDISHVEIPPVGPEERIIPVLDNGSGSGTLTWDLTQGRLRAYVGEHKALAVVTVEERQRLIESRVSESIRPLE